MGTFSGEATLPFLFSLAFPVGSTHKEKNLLLKEQIPSIKSRPHFRRTSLAAEVERSHKSYSPWKKIAKKNLLKTVCEAMESRIEPLFCVCRFLGVHTRCMQTAKALCRLCRCINWSKCFALYVVC